MPDLWSKKREPRGTRDDLTLIGRDHKLAQQEKQTAHHQQQRRGQRGDKKQTFHRVSSSSSTNFTKQTKPEARRLI